MKYDRVPMEPKPIAVKLDKALLARIDATSKRMGEPRSTVMRVAMRLGLDGLEKAFQTDPQKTLSSLHYPLTPDEGVLVEEGGKPKKKFQKFNAAKLGEEIERSAAAEIVLSSPEGSSAEPAHTSPSAAAAGPDVPTPRPAPPPAEATARSKATGPLAKRKRTPRTSHK